MGYAVIEDTPERFVFVTGGMSLFFALLIPGIIIFVSFMIFVTTIAFSWIPAIIFVVMIIVAVFVGRTLVVDAVQTYWTLTVANGRCYLHREKGSFMLCCVSPISQDYELSTSGVCASLEYGRKGTSRVVLHLADGTYLPTTNSFSNLYYMQKEQLVVTLNSLFRSHSMFVPSGISSQPAYIPPTTPYVPPTVAYPPPEVAQPSAYAPPQYAPPEPYMPPSGAYIPPQPQAMPPPNPYQPPEISPYVPPPVVQPPLVTDPSARNVGEQAQKVDEVPAQVPHEVQQTSERVLQTQGPSNPPM